MAADTGQSAQMLRAMNRIRFNADSSSLPDDRSDGLSDYARQAIENHQLEQERMQRDRPDLLQQRVRQDIGTDSDLAARMASMRVPPSSILSASFPSSKSSAPPPPPPPIAPPQTVSMSSNRLSVPPPQRIPRSLP